jgi:hypothetical protein
MSYLRGERMRLEKQREGRPEKLPQKEEVIKGETAVKLADQYKVSPRTIECDADYARDVNAIAAVADTQGARIVMETEAKLGCREVTAHACCVGSTSGALCRLCVVSRGFSGLGTQIEVFGPSFHPMEAVGLHPIDLQRPIPITHDDVVSLSNRLFECSWL